MWVPPGRGDSDVATFVIIIALLTLMLAVLYFAYRRRRRNPDRGGSGYTPAVFSVAPDSPAAPENGRDDVDSWLLGFAAPFVVRAGLDPWAWDLGRWSADAEIRARVAQAVSAVGVVDDVVWRRGEQRAQDGVKRAVTASAIAWAIADLAWWYRLGVAAEHIDVELAHARTQSVAQHISGHAADWFTFGDLLERSEPDFSVRELYALGQPWAEPAWPADR